MGGGEWVTGFMIGLDSTSFAFFVPPAMVELRAPDGSITLSHELEPLGGGCEIGGAIVEGRVRVDQARGDGQDGIPIRSRLRVGSEGDRRMDGVFVDPGKDGVRGVDGMAMEGWMVDWSVDHGRDVRLVGRQSS